MVALKSLFISSLGDVYDSISYFKSVAEAQRVCASNAVTKESIVLRDWEYSDACERIPVIERVLITPAGQILTETIIKIQQEWVEKNWE